MPNVAGVARAYPRRMLRNGRRHKEFSVVHTLHCFFSATSAPFVSTMTDDWDAMRPNGASHAVVSPRGKQMESSWLRSGSAGDDGRLDMPSPLFRSVGIGGREGSSPGEPSSGVVEDPPPLTCMHYCCVHGRQRGVQS